MRAQRSTFNIELSCLLRNLNRAVCLLCFGTTAVTVLLLSPRHPHYPSPLCSTFRYTELLTIAFLRLPLYVMGANVDVEAQQNALPAPPRTGAFISLPFRRSTNDPHQFFILNRT